VYVRRLAITTKLYSCTPLRAVCTKWQHVMAVQPPVNLHSGGANANVAMQATIVESSAGHQSVNTSCQIAAAILRHQPCEVRCHHCRWRKSTLRPCVPHKLPRAASSPTDSVCTIHSRKCGTPFPTKHSDCSCHDTHEGSLMLRQL
jgi:hypothetical protein